MVIISFLAKFKEIFMKKNLLACKNKNSGCKISREYAGDQIQCKFEEHRNKQFNLFGL